MEHSNDATAPSDLGILGGGQLARMTLLAASALGIDVAIMDLAPDSPAGRLTRHEVVAASWGDEAALRQFAALAPTITLENEFVPARSLYVLEEAGAIVVPQSSALAAVQDKLHQKTCLAAAGLPVPPFRPVEDARDVLAAARDMGWPLLLKRRRNGYDGYGNRTLRGPDDVIPAMATLQGAGDRPHAERALMVEGFVAFDRELAVMVVRGRDGEVRQYPVAETVQRNHVCHHVCAPADVPSYVAARAAALARAAATALDLRGVVGVEIFLMADGSVAINEMAPRVHNSGHYTIEGCVTSQFENAVRAALNLPLGETHMIAPAAAMVNLLGSREAPGRPDGLEDALAVPGAHVHLYGKGRSRPGRKMGHVTALGATVEAAMSAATRAAGTIVI